MLGIPYDAAATSTFVDQAGATQTTQSGLEALRVAHTFDPCIACAVH
jgi:Ni,Fe-hydrogenase I large subunit